MNKEYTSSVILCITGHDLLPEMITEKLSLQPSQAWKRGDQFVFKSGRTHVYEWGGWKLFSTGCDDLLLEEQFKWWVRLLASKKETLHFFKSLGLSVVLDCYLSIALYNPATIHIDSSLLSQLAEIGADVEFGVFNFNNSEEKDKIP